MTPSSDTNSVTTIRAAISRSPLLQLLAYRLLLTPEHLHSQTHAARERSNASSHAQWWRTARHDRLPNRATFGFVVAANAEPGFGIHRRTSCSSRSSWLSIWVERHLSVAATSRS